MIIMRLLDKKVCNNYTYISHYLHKTLGAFWSILYVPLCIITVLLSNPTLINSQDEDAIFIKKIFDEALAQNESYVFLQGLCQEGKGRIAGSPAYIKAAAYGLEKLQRLGLDSVYYQDVQARYWDRGNDDFVYLYTGHGDSLQLASLALGNTVSTPLEGIKGHVIEVHSLSALESLGQNKVRGKIVFFNRPMDPTKVNTFHAYGGAADQRVQGPIIAARMGAVGCLVRSLTTSIDEVPHTGVTSSEGSMRIPAMAISTRDADRLSVFCKDTSTRIHMCTHAQDKGMQYAPNVIGEWAGSAFKNKIILVGGHLDAWDVSEGAHDDGSGIAHAYAALDILKKLNYTPQHTLRAVFFSNEENGLAGGLAYAKLSQENNEWPCASIESDSGGFSPRSFSFDADTVVLKKYYKHIYAHLPLFESYGITFELGGSGADINPLKPQKGLLVGLRTDAQKYFDFHHTENDVIANVHPRELALGSAAMAALVYIIDKYGVE